MSAWDAGRVTALMLEAGGLALETFRRSRAELKRDRSLVTEADLAVEGFLRGRLEDPAAGRYLIGEESAEAMPEERVRAALAAEAWVADPVDGTANYAAGLELWGVSLGLLDRGRLTDGAIFLPALGELFLTDGPLVRLLHVERGRVTEESVVDFAPVLDRDKGLVAVSQAIAKRGHVLKDNPVHALATAVYPLVNIVRGRYVAYIGSLKLWDVAGGIPMALRAGLDISLWDGTPVGAAVDATVYHLDAGSQRRWHLRDMIVFCPPGQRDWFTQGIARRTR